MVLSARQREVREWLAERQAILLAHNYQPGEIQDVADLTGDSLGLSQAAARTEARVIVFCGVHFMAETAAILCPDKTVLLPRIDAGCYMADTITAPALRARKAELPETPVVMYVNSSAAVKAESDICCTSANAVRVVNSLSQDQVLMAPDRNLALYTQRYTSKKVFYWEGCCNIHDALSREEVLACKAVHPGAPFIAHPECRPEVLDLAEVIRSTSGMLSYVKQAPQSEFIIGTEKGIIYTLAQENPDKRFYSPSDRMLCPDMKKISLADVLTALRDMAPVVTVPEDIRVRALQAVNRMLAVPRD
ncbi:MAG: quinolinate synthase NadA [Deltaproteobacteria bacterium]|nr:quinolinate synthase NadA [Deltaproteobacteria bacterium]